MKFIDLIKLKVKAGKGGDGIIAFRRELYVPKGGPSGGDGGNGGSVVFVGDEGLNTLLDLRKTREITAKAGENGKPKNMHGKNGTSVLIKVPLGTIVKNAKTNEVIADIIKHKQEAVIAKGGIGGRGNAKFASSTNRVPKISENGTLGEEFEIICELKLLANAGLIGLPNAGKSTFLSVVSAAKPVIADYPFTTLDPQLAVVKVHDDSFVIADLPGLIAGASDGKGLGLQFLKHIERCQVLVHMIDVSDNSSDHFLTYQLIIQELSKYNKNILKKPEIIVANKIDKISDSSIVKKLEKQLKKPVFAISALNKTDLKPLLEEINRLVKQADIDKEEIAQEMQEHTLYKYQTKDKSELEVVVKKVAAHEWEVTGATIKKMAQKNPLNTHQNILLFQIKLQDLGVFQELRKKGIKKGDSVKIFNYDMIWEEEN
ncbi:GTPase ObgE [Spiroplasma platyhelix]|uniref:GTPase Obg n=1 Tax=Spiroplasma platyhelix PALS-1 TaxID=1276218 RepID=A0A846UD04_9MOLU|nr:GTPase ObgE [Spiroplasma platyhelix]MBE4704027.1 GTPase Obg [Spiroplasma platyhelix PALS-1]NKE38398.1 GTPase ObgE [Spiroplasma platyhelix PALS-1]UJB29285.1 GTPase ObgE [Spiroplasma platyhelix PALS-1]